MSNVEAPARLQQLVPPLAELYPPLFPQVAPGHRCPIFLESSQTSATSREIHPPGLLHTPQRIFAGFEPYRYPYAVPPYLSSSESFVQHTYNDLNVKTALCPASVLGLRSAISRSSVEGKRDPLLLFRNPRHPHWHFPPSSQSAPDSAFRSKRDENPPTRACVTNQTQHPQVSILNRGARQPGLTCSPLLTEASAILQQVCRSAAPTSIQPLVPRTGIVRVPPTPRKAPKLRRPPI